MQSDRGGRVAGIRRRVLVVLAAAFVVPMAVLASASPALAVRPFEKFQSCPTEVPIVIECSYGVTSAGEFTINKTTVPINKSIVQQGGSISAGSPTEPTLEVSIGAKAGFESFQKVALNVPGGLTGIIDCTKISNEFLRNTCKFFFEHGITELTATLEPVANEHNPPLINSFNLTTEKGTAVTLPARVHLKNELLGNACYIGSEASPIQLHLTTGTSGTLKGKLGSLSTLKEEIPGEEEPVRALHIANNSLVDNTFSVPVSEGCGELFGVKGVLDSVINEKVGLPSAAGNNKAKLDGELNSASREEVIRSGF
jgi:hypothetical protein